MRAEAMRLLTALAVLLPAAAGVHAQTPDPRVGLKAGWRDAGVAARNVELVGSAERPAAFVNEKNLGDILLANSDMAFSGTTLFMGSFHGFQIWDISDPKSLKLRTAFVCPGGQGDMSVHGNLLFMSVEMPNGKLDCANAGMAAFNDSVSTTRFMGVRIFDISDITKPKQIKAIQTCRGSHTHTLVPGKDSSVVYIYVQGTSGVRSPTELAGCSGLPPEKDRNTSYFRIEIIKVPVAAPQNAAIVNMPRIFARGDTIAGLWQGGTHGEGTQATATTNQCHDITVYPALDLAAGACSGNGILLDISDRENPVRIAEVEDPNFAYWHSATFNNDGSKVIFTDEWGGGMAARCLATDKREWGADALFELKDRKLELKGYYKLPAAQSAQENCVAHNGSLIPVPGRDIMVQAWYQGGMSVFDFTDPAHPVEIAYFDRGPYNEKELLLGGMWSTYWYNGRIYASEIGRGLDVFELKPSEHLSQNEIDAAKLVRVAANNPQTQAKIVWPASFVVGRAYLDQLKRAGVNADAVAADLQRAEAANGDARKAALAQAAANLARLNSSTRAATQLADLIRQLGS